MTEYPKARALFAAVMDDATCERVLSKMGDEEFDARVLRIVERNADCTLARIASRLPGYSEDAIRASLRRLLDAERIRIYPRSLSSVRRWNGSYVYEARS